MQSYRLFEESIEKGELKISALILELDNAVFLIISEKGYRVSTMAGGVPSPSKVSDMRATSFRILGTRNLILASALAERIAHSLKKIAFVSVATDEEEPIQKLVLELVNKILEKVS
ncbi:MAG: hypothetical protein KAI34_02460 [Candidatus Lokiarchaeota archaeon]|nr:hypothetical protein [Candidatus Lokiarchaeota archaeon]